MSVYKIIGSYVICMNQLCYNIFNPMENFFSGRICLLSVHNRNMKHARAIEFGSTNLLAMLRE